ncbi:MAG: NAD(P)H-dependent oxidoreductase [Nevskiales bacterium]|nr:NAD(P)H-dependent oxidoreductase [Nevskiales bacterium]
MRKAARHILVIQGHPDPSGRHFCDALAAAYADGARAAGHRVRRLRVARIEFPLLSRRQDWETAARTPEAIRDAQDAIVWAEHLVIVYPLWLGSMPARLKGFFEQVLRPGFAIEPLAGGRLWAQCLKGRSAHIIVTMGMPGTVYRLYFRAHSLKALERNILRFCGIGPIRETVIGMVEGAAVRRARALERVRRDGGRAR